jgi:hypothetical protein
MLLKLYDCSSKTLFSDSKIDFLDLIWMSAILLASILMFDAARERAIKSDY